MTRAATAQGFAFSIAAIVISLLTVMLPALNQRTELIVLGILILLLGVPHGALDTVFASQLYGVHTTKGWCLFGLAYMVPAALVVAIWQLAPVLFLLVFLMISVAHFSGDPALGTPAITRVLYGALIILLPTIRHASEVTRLFALLVGESAALHVVPTLTLLAWPWLICALGAAIICFMRARWLAGLEICSVSMLAIFADPLVAFTVFFCGMHSARHILRTVDYSATNSLRFVIAASVVPMVGFLVMLGGAWLWLRNVPLEARLLQLIFVGLAAMTVPHMALVERVRCSGWRRQRVFNTKTVATASRA